MTKVDPAKETSVSSSQPAPTAASGGLEATLPHLTKKVCLLWGSHDFEPFVHSLLMDSRDGDRKGLPWEAAEELLFLNELSVAKRALVAAEITGVPYNQVFRTMLANAEAANMNPAQSWNNPNLNRDANRGKTELAIHTDGTQRSGKKKSWWQRLFD